MDGNYSKALALGSERFRGVRSFLRCPRGIIYRLVTPRENRTAEQKLRGYPVEIGTTTRSRAVYTVPACRRTVPSTARVIKPVS